MVSVVVVCDARVGRVGYWGTVTAGVRDPSTLWSDPTAGWVRSMSIFCEVVKTRSSSSSMKLWVWSPISMPSVPRSSACTV